MGEVSEDRAYFYERQIPVTGEQSWREKTSEAFEGVVDLAAQTEWERLRSEEHRSWHDASVAGRQKMRASVRPMIQALLDSGLVVLAGAEKGGGIDETETRTLGDR